MFLEQYKKFKKSFNNSEDVYEQYSLGNSGLFGLDFFFSREYLNGEKFLDVELINDFDKELHSVLLKTKFIYSYLKNYLDTQKEESMNLDNEYFEICNSVSTKGQAFLNMFNMPEHFNHIVETKTVYLKNIKEYSNYSIKNDDDLSEIPYYISEVDKNQFYINFNQLNKIDSMLIEFYNTYTINVFGITENGTMENLLNSVETTQEIFIFKNDKKYKSLFVLSSSNISNYIKNIKVFSYQGKKSANKCGYLIKKIESLDNIKEFSVINDSTTQFYLYNKNEYRQLMNMLAKDEDGAKNKYINDNYKIKLNETIEVASYNDKELYLLEFFDYENNKSYITQIYGKEKE